MTGTVVCAKEYIVMYNDKNRSIIRAYNITGYIRTRYYIKKIIIRAYKMKNVYIRANPSVAAAASSSKLCVVVTPPSSSHSSPSSPRVLLVFSAADNSLARRTTLWRADGETFFLLTFHVKRVVNGLVNMINIRRGLENAFWIQGRFNTAASVSQTRMDVLLSRNVFFEFLPVVLKRVFGRGKKKISRNFSSRVSDSFQRRLPITHFSRVSA